MTNFQSLKYELRGPMALITLNRPQVLNALDVSLFNELRGAFIEAQVDPAVQVCILTGEGRAFCAGADVKSVAAHHSSERDRLTGAFDYAQAADAMFAQVAQMDKVVIAMVNGIAHAAGIVLACCCDIAVASDRATFRVPEGLVGIADELSTTWLKESVGLARARYLVLTADTISALEAREMGMIAKVVPHGELWSATEEVARRVMKTGPRARAVFKRLLNEAVPKIELRHIVESHLSEESREGSEAFSKKRPANWQ